MKISIDVGCAIIRRAGKLLIAQRHLHDSYGGRWEFPGGKREEGETIEECLKREVQEELGIRILPRELLCRRDHENAEKKLSLFFYFCDWTEGEARAHDCKDFRWISAQDVGQYEFLPGDTEVVRDLVAHWPAYFTQKGP